MASIRTLGDRVLVQRQAEEKQSTIILPNEEKQNFGRVIEKGPDASNVAPNDKVIFGKYSGTEVTISGEEYIVMKEEDILAVVED